MKKFYSGNLFRTNVVVEFGNVYKIQDCQEHCQKYRSQGQESARDRDPIPVDFQFSGLRSGFF